MTPADLLSSSIGPALVALGAVMVTAAFLPALGIVILVRYIHAAVEAA